MRALIFGSRRYTHRGSIATVIGGLAVVYRARGPLTIVHGKARSGADQLADEIAHGMGFAVEPHPADWYGPCDPASGLCQPGHRQTRDGRDYCPTAGFRRNATMAASGLDVAHGFVVAGVKASGSLDMAARAEAAGVPTYLTERRGADL